MRASNADVELAERRVELERAESIRRVQTSLSATGSSICVGCGEDIDPERIAALPSARRCIECEKRLERLKWRHA